MTKSEIDQFYTSPVWKAIEERVRAEMDNIDVGIENPDPYQHGKAVGKRDAHRLFLKYREILLDEAEGKNPYGG